ncbi:MAG: putative metal-binding motif-containing protein, partial [Myxococcaceae bacterium]|nr:putative metal-binding motif-containing protein [Myxococcaceae bacterium]
MRLLVPGLIILSSTLAACGKGEKVVPHDAGNPLPMETCLDNDGDGFAGTGKCSNVPYLDCNDDDSAVHPEATEVCNGIDDDCDGVKEEGLPNINWYADADGDGVGSAQIAGSGCGAPPMGQVTQTGDCNDTNPMIRPGVAETCNDVDDDCDGTKDNGLPFQDFHDDVDGDGFGDAMGAPQSSCLTAVMGKVPNKSDCADRDPTVKPGATEICNRRDDNCDGQIDNGITYLGYYPDVDGDSFGAAGSTVEMSCGPVAGKVTNALDCDDANPTTKPGAPEMCNGVDDNCLNGVDEGLTFMSYYPDADGDGVGSIVAPMSSCLPIAGRVTTTGDCNDNNAMVKPGATEVCNGVDDDCVGGPDNGLNFLSYYTDGDNDGFGAGAAMVACLPIAGRVTNNTDCNDANPAIKPGATETCNGMDDDCAGGIDNGLQFLSYYPDVDGDTYGNRLAPPQSSCNPVPNKVANSLDCDDTRFAVKPGATEVCNGMDDDCDGPVDEGLTFSSYYPDFDLDGYGSASAMAQSSCAPVPGKVTNNTDCNDGLATVRPNATETCNGVDDDCDGTIDDNTMTLAYYVDSDNDGYGTGAPATAIMSCAPISGRAPNNTDCDDTRGGVHPGATEVCNGIDDNCAGGIDNGLTFLSYWPDGDGDGFGSSSMSAVSACAPVMGRVTNNTDCNDANANVRPNATEVCNGIDDNCAGGIDNGLPTQSYWADGDGDGFGAGSPVMQCGPLNGRVANGTDCNDLNANVRPTATEVCNGIDDNCAGGVDEGNPGGGAACATGLMGVCGPGTRTCVSGSLQCVGTVSASAELCNGLDDDCDGPVDETFTDKGAACSAGVGVCLRTGTRECAPGGASTICSVDAGSPTAPACDGLDNDCDGVTDEPYLSSTYNIASPVAWTDLEVTPYYYSSPGCAGGVNGTGTDALLGGALVMAGGTDGLYFQRLDTSGTPTGAVVTIQSSFRYTDVAVVQSGDGFIVAGLYDTASDGTGNEVDFYYVDSNGATRDDAWSLFSTGNTLDSLRLVRGNGRRVMAVWREAGVGLRHFRVEPTLVSTTWSITQVGGAALSTTTQPTTLVANAAVLPGVGADSAAWDWASTQTCVATTTLMPVGVAYRDAPAILKHFTVNENGTSKSADVVVRDLSTTSGRSLSEPDVSFFRDASANHWFIGYVMHDATAMRSDLEVWQTNDPGYNWAWLSFATANGTFSIARPRTSVTPTRLQVTASRWVTDPSAFKKQVMTRQFDYLGSRLPGDSAVELAVTSGACSGDPPCRPGDKDGLTSWAAFGRLYYSAG